MESNRQHSLDVKEKAEVRVAKAQEDVDWATNRLEREKAMAKQAQDNYLEIDEKLSELKQKVDTSEYAATIRRVCPQISDDTVAAHVGQQLLRAVDQFQAVL